MELNYGHAAGQNEEIILKGAVKEPRNTRTDAKVMENAWI